MRLLIIKQQEASLFKAAKGRGRKPRLFCVRILNFGNKL